MVERDPTTMGVAARRPLSQLHALLRDPRDEQGFSLQYTSGVPRAAQHGLASAGPGPCHPDLAPNGEPNGEPGRFRAAFALGPLSGRPRARLRLVVRPPDAALPRPPRLRAPCLLPARSLTAPPLPPSSPPRRPRAWPCRRVPLLHGRVT